jgi:cytoskeletal protein CcmA (bactofilin family)
MAKNYEDNPNSLNIIGEGTSITGDMTSNGDIRIDGGLNGNINTKAKLVLGNSGKITGEVYCKNSELSGELNGKITIEEMLILKSTAKVLGDIITSKLSIEPGAIFTGTCNMGGNFSTKAGPANSNE